MHRGARPGAIKQRRGQRVEGLRDVRLQYRAQIKKHPRRKNGRGVDGRRI